MAKKEEAKEVLATAPEVVEETPAEETVAEDHYAKAGKKSKKHQEEVKAEEERQARKVEKAAEPEKKAGPKPVTRSRLERRGKNYRKVSEKIEKKKPSSSQSRLAPLSLMRHLKCTSVLA